MLPPLLDIEEIHRRLQIIFPEGTSHRNYVVREISARTIFVMLYVGAIEGSARWIGPKHVYRMGDVQAGQREDVPRLAYMAAVEKPGFQALPDRWFQDNTREPIRDETLREGLIRMGAVVERAGLPTTSSKPRYALHAGFAALFHPALHDEPLALAIAAWQERSLSAGALARVRLRQRSANAAQSKILIRMPNGESRQMESGRSSVITKAVVEAFAPRFLGDPAVMWISESGNKVVQRDDQLAKQLGLSIQTDKLLPDIVLVDLAPAEPLLVFVEAVASDGPVTESRRGAFIELVTTAGFIASQVAFVTAFHDRDSAEFKKALPNLAWGSFAWCLSEPDHLIALDGVIPAGIRHLSDFIT